MTIKFFFFILTASYISQNKNNLTSRDESTFIKEAVNTNFNIYSEITPGDAFIVKMGSFILYLFDNNINMIKILPILSTIIVFHFIYKITKFLQYSNLDKFIIINFTLLLPSYLLFHNSYTKDFLQLMFFISSIYYSLKIIKNFKYICMLKLLISLLLFSFSHVGFDLLSLVIIIFVIIFKLSTFINIKNTFVTSFSIIFLIMLFIITLMIVAQLEFFNKIFVLNNFGNLLQEIRFDTSESINNYEIPLLFDNFINTTVTFFNLLAYYLFYIKNIFLVKNLYYFFEIFLLSIVFLYITFQVAFNQNDYFSSKNKKYYNYLIFLFLSYIVINFGFSIFTSNFGNSLRHKTISNFILFLYFPFIRMYLLEYISSFYKKLYD